MAALTESVAMSQVTMAEVTMAEAAPLPEKISQLAHIFNPELSHAPQETAQRHLPVLAQRCIDLLAPALQHQGAVLVDGTLGLGGHTELALTQLPNLTVIGIDRDTEALALATERLAKFGARFIPVHANYSEIADVVKAEALDSIDGILLDLGVSSLQLDEPERGFSYMKDAALDMRMDQTAELTAADILNTYSESELKRILFQFGEERFSPRIAQNIVARRSVKPWQRTGELAELIQNSIPRKAQLTGGHPAKRTFQALRIEVNRELAGLAEAIPSALTVLAPGGRMVVEAYQSLEDRIVKQAFAAGLRSTAPVGLPVALPDDEPYLRALTRGAEKADAGELERNSRAASVRLRAVEKIGALGDWAAVPTKRVATGANGGTTTRDSRLRPESNYGKRGSER